VAYHVPSDRTRSSSRGAGYDDAGGRTHAGRLYKALVRYEERPPRWPCQRAGKGSGLAVAYADVRLEKSVEDARDTTVATVEGIAKNPFTKEELERDAQNGSRISTWR